MGLIVGAALDPRTIGIKQSPLFAFLRAHAQNSSLPFNLAKLSTDLQAEHADYQRKSRLYTGIGLAILVPLLAGLLIATSTRWPGQQARFLAIDNYEAGNRAFDTKNFRDAIAHFSAAMTDAGSTASLLYNRGASYLNLGEYTAAKTDFEEILRTNPHSADGHYGLALVAAKNDDRDTATHHLEKVLTLTGPDWWNRAGAEQLAKELGLAIEGPQELRPNPNPNPKATGETH